MSMRVSRSTSYISSCGVGSSGFGAAGGMALSGVGCGRSGISLSYGGRARSVYGGAGGNGTRISRSTMLTSPMIVPTCEVTLSTNEKHTMQNLNDRLASYLEKVRSLEAANHKLELQIKEFYETRSPAQGNDLTAFHTTITDLRNQILARCMVNAQISLQVDNAKLAAEDFQMKYEMEMNTRLTVEADMAQLKEALNELKLCRDLELQISGLQDELLFLRQNHEEELQLVRAQQGGDVSVELDCPASQDLGQVLEEMRAQYGAVVQKNHRNAEQWFERKTELLQNQVTTSTTEIRSSKSEMTDMKGTLQSLEIELQRLLTQKQHLEQTAAEVDGRYGAHLGQLQLHIDGLQGELQQLNASIQQQAAEYQLLLNVKMRLEMEIAEYRRLLDGEGVGFEGALHLSSSSRTVSSTMNGGSEYRSGSEINSSSTTSLITKTVEIEEVEEKKEEDEYNPHRQRRVKVIVEQLVDGRVVSSSVEENIQDVITTNGRDNTRLHH